MGIGGTCLRYLAWAQKASALSFCLLGALLAWLERGDEDRYAEAVYLNAAVIVLLSCGSLSFVRGFQLASEDRHWMPIRQWKSRADSSLRNLGIPLLFDAEAGDEPNIEVEETEIGVTE